MMQPVQVQMYRIRLSTTEAVQDQPTGPQSGTEACWSGVYTADRCCDLTTGPTGDSSCWSGSFDFDFCCPAGTTASPDGSGGVESSGIQEPGTMRSAAAPRSRHAFRPATPSTTASSCWRRSTGRTPSSAATWPTCCRSTRGWARRARAGTTVPLSGHHCVLFSSGIWSSGGLLCGADSGCGNQHQLSNRARPKRAHVSGDPGLSESPRWGSGGFAVRQFGSLSLSYVTLTGLLSVVVVGGSLVLSSCDVRVSAAVVR